jgi:glycosyltransferase involved in cell wall biosynthesis
MDIINLNFLDIDIVLWALIVIVLLSFITQLYYYTGVFSRIGLKKNKPATPILEPVSVILCAHNEAENLREILPLLLRQNYPEYEVIVVLTASTDASEDVLTLAKSQYPHLQIRNLSTSSNSMHHGKSIVLGVGIKAAQYDRIMLTTPDCRPSLDWLQAVSAGFDAGIVLGYTRYTNNKLIQTANYFESLFRLGYALKNRPYTGSGENAGFEKKFFFEKKFNPLLGKQDKPEQVFLNSILNKNNTSVVLSPDAINTSTLSLSLKQWCRERSGELYSQRLFRKGSSHIKLPEIASRAVFYTSIPTAVYMSLDTQWLWLSFAGIFAIRFLVVISVFFFTQKALCEQKLLVRTILWDFYSIFVYLYIALLFRHRRRLKYN